MKYHLGDKFEVQGILCHVRLINNGKAWVFPVEDVTEGLNTHLSFCALECLDEKGLDSKGNKAITIFNKECQAV